MTDEQIYALASKRLKISSDIIAVCDKVHWKHVKDSLQNPDADVLEIPQFGTWVIINSRMRSTLKFSIRILRRIKKRLSNPKDKRAVREWEDNVRLFRNLWKLKQECKFN